LLQTLPFLAFTLDPPSIRINNRQTIPRLPLQLLPTVNFNAHDLKCQPSRFYSTDQSVRPRIVSNSTAPYPSMGFAPLQGLTILSLCSSCSPHDALLETRYTLNATRESLSTISRCLLSLSKRTQSLTSASHNPFHSCHSKIGKPNSQFNPSPQRTRCRSR
jgi:hypothetical protein